MTIVQFLLLALDRNREQPNPNEEQAALQPGGVESSGVRLG